MLGKPRQPSATRSFANVVKSAKVPKVVGLRLAYASSADSS